MTNATGEIDCTISALFSTRGVEEIIEMITARRMVHRLVLHQNSLGDDGCVALFKFLGSSNGRKYRVSYISLNSNHIGERGLLAIVEYLKDNQYLKQLHLQNNNLTGCTSTFTTFADAVNSSQLEDLYLSSNGELSDPFIETFLPALKSPHLRDLCISALDITPRSCPHIVAYLSSPARCHLRSFNCSCNALGPAGVRSIIDAIQRYNYSILMLQLYWNNLTEGVPGDEEESHVGLDQLSDKNTEALTRALTRNRLLNRETERQALRLLRYARPLLLRTSRSSVALSSTSAPRIPEASPPLRLPTEILQYILSLFGPTLSNAQRIRIYNYASTRSTLPPLLPNLSLGTTIGVDNPILTGMYSRTRDEASARCLKAIGCDNYEKEIGEELDGERVKWTIDIGDGPWRA